MSVRLQGELNRIDLDVDSTPKAVRASRYDSGSFPAASFPVGSYLAPIDFRGGSVPTGSGIFLLKNGSSRYVSVRRLFLMGHSNPLAAAASNWYIAVARCVGLFSFSTPT